jgi:2-amino-4-hydroxy-6-hydroxymethyldihydropteridine diphosphokinase
VDCPPDTPPFLNSVIELATSLAPGEVFQRCQRLEIELGRPASHALNAPRTLDLDLLYCDDRRIDEPNLIIPHPRLHLRGFVLAPLADIRPGLILPGQEKSIAELLAELESHQSKPTLVGTEW